MAIELLSIGLSTVIGVGVPVAVVILVYLIYTYSIAEKSFEEVIEEQKRRSIEEELQQKLEKSKKEKKFKKTWGKKSKEKVEQEVVPEKVSIQENNEDVAPIEIIEPKETKPVKQKSKSKGNIPSATPLNADKPKKVDAVVPEKTVSEKKKDALPVVKETEKIKTEPKAAEVLKPKVEEIVESVSVSNAVQAVSAPTVTAGKKKKKEQVDKDIIPLTTSKLLSLIKESELDTEEIQTLIDILLNKQKDSTGWTKPNDPLAITKKNLLEKEQLLDQELRQNQTMTTKLKDLREEYNQVKTKLSAQEKVSQEKISRQQQDIQALNLRVKQVQEQLAAEKEKHSQIEKQAEEKIEAAIKNVEEEKAKLQQKLAKLEAESRIGVTKTEIDALKKSKEDLQKVHNLLVEQHTQLVSTHKNDLKNFKAQINDAETRLNEVKAKNETLLKDIEVLKESKAVLELSEQVLKEKVEAEQIRCADLESQAKQLLTKISELNKLQAEVKELKLENERLAEQLVSTKERVAGDGQEIVHQNGEVNGKAQDEDILKSIEEKDKLLKEKEVLLTQLNEDLNKQKAKISVLSEEIENQKQKNNELREKNWKAMDALTNAEKSAELKIKEIQTSSEQKLLQVRKEYEEKLQNTSNSAQTEELSKRTTKAEDEAAKRLTDYNNELEKNKKLESELDRISALNKSSELRISEMEKFFQELKVEVSETQSKAKACLQRIHPDIVIDSSLPFDTWLEEYTKQASLAVQVAPSNGEETELQNKVQHYEKALAETESIMLNLQKRAAAAEAIWQSRLKKKEQELAQILSERDALAAEKETMQSTFQQISQLEELQEKLKLLQSTLESAENERSHLEQKYDEVQKNCINLRDQLEDKEKQVLELQKESNRNDSLKKEIEDLKTKLEKEKKISKDFSSQMVRLNSLVKIGQDALTAEQEMVKKLKSQLEAAQVSTANGTSPTTIQSPVVNSESQPQSKSSAKSKKKMDASAKK
ncbi:ribosome-binding protein 1-like isoform X1 [Stegodyphus dumicola]|uniref:ribosome-binding protein 1-like isoform X1 n=1 Tax=Stegodyphus dumicola TaxID=202533 RepID=UPI0015B0E6AE|nr:ribosome-binding protein 1-like isoform X1 [Stegodyphus dumicola]